MSTDFDIGIELHGHLLSWTLTEFSLTSFFIANLSLFLESENFRSLYLKLNVVVNLIS